MPSSEAPRSSLPSLLPSLLPSGAAGIRQLKTLHLTGAGADGPERLLQEQWVAEEVPIAFELNGISQAVMLASPMDLEDFAFGFCLTEGLILQAAELHDVQAEETERGILLHLSVSARCEARLKERRRSLLGRTGCGLCGVESLEQLALTPRPLTPPLHVDGRALQEGVRRLGQWQPLHGHTGALHAAAFCLLDGQIALVREDVGRHNALDKTIGALLRAGLEPQSGFLAITSRAGVELVHKAVVAGVGALAAVSAPTTLAVSLAEQSGLILAAFVRESRATLYAHGDRVV